MYYFVSGQETSRGKSAAFLKIFEKIVCVVTVIETLQSLQNAFLVDTFALESEKGSRN